MSDKIYSVAPKWAHDAYIDAAQYKEMYANSVAHKDQFWAEHGRRIDWIKPFTKVKHTSFDPHNVSIKWFEDGITNVALNCIDRHLADKRRPDRHHLGGRRPRRNQAYHL